MFKIKIVTVHKIKEHWLEEALSDYEKRMKHTVEFEWFLAKDSKSFLAFVEKESQYIALDPEGTTFTSIGFAKKLFSYLHKKNSLTLIIGDAEGLPLSVKEKSQELWSLSPLTFTHQLTRLILIEQIYRALEIEKGSPYHK